MEGNAVSAVVFWPVKNESLTATSFLLICLSVVDNFMLFFFYLLLGVPFICVYTGTCQFYMKVQHAASAAAALTTAVFSER